MSTTNTETAPAAPKDEVKNLSPEALAALARTGADDEIDTPEDGEVPGEVSGDRGDAFEPEPEAPAKRSAKAEDDDEPEPVVPKAERSKSIPRDRFDQVNARMKAAEAKLREQAAQREATQQANAFDFDGKEKEQVQAILDGDTDKALALRKEIRSAERAVLQAEMAAPLQNVTERVTTEMDLKQAVKSLTAKYPVFDPNSDTYDDAITEETLALFEAYKTRGYTPAEAMGKAAKMMAQEYGFGEAETAEPAPTKAGKKVPTAAQRAAKLDVAKKQPTSGVIPKNEDSDPSLDEMSEEDFDKLPEATKRRMRGDTL